jgi:alkanesulfonate monooxygenase
MIGMVGTRDASEIKGPLTDGPVVDWMDGPVIDSGYLADISRAHDEADFDRVLVGYGAVAPEGWMVAASVLASTSRLGCWWPTGPDSSSLSCWPAWRPPSIT